VTKNDFTTFSLNLKSSHPQHYGAVNTNTRTKEILKCFILYIYTPLRATCSILKRLMWTSGLKILSTLISINYQSAMKRNEPALTDTPTLIAASKTFLVISIQDGEFGVAITATADDLPIASVRWWTQFQCTLRCILIFTYFTDRKNSRWFSLRHVFAKIQL